MEPVRILRLIFVGVILGTLSAMPFAATAQDAGTEEDWTLTRLPDTNTIGASLTFDNGLSVVTRCQNGVFDLILGGLPPAPAGMVSRPLTVLSGEKAEEQLYAWTVGSDRTSAFSRIPALFARILAKGGPLQIIVPGAAGQPRTRYVMTLPSSGAAVEETLTRCGRPLVDPRDDRLVGDGDGLPNGITWLRSPRPNFPGSVGGALPEMGFVVTTCLVGAGGRLEDCQLESEQPANFNLGRAVMRALPNARVTQAPDARAAGRPFEGVMISFSTNFILH